MLNFSYKERSNPLQDVLVYFKLPAGFVSVLFEYRPSESTINARVNDKPFRGEQEVITYAKSMKNNLVFGGELQDVCELNDSIGVFANQFLWYVDKMKFIRKKVREEEWQSHVLKTSSQYERMPLDRYLALKLYTEEGKVHYLQGLVDKYLQSVTLHACEVAGSTYNEIKYVAALFPSYYPLREFQKIFSQQVKDNQKLARLCMKKFLYLAREEYEKIPPLQKGIDALLI